MTAPGPKGSPATGEASGATLYQELRSRIIHLDLAPGTRLTEQSLARQHGMSRTPVRRVLDRLAHEGLVTINPGSGASVSPIDYQEMREVWALRLKIAELVGHFVQLPPVPEVIERLQGLLRQLDSIDSWLELAPLYDEYHAIMLDIMSNGPLRSIHDQLYARTARMFAQLLPRLDLRAEIEAIQDEIGGTIDACRDGSGHRLAEIRTKHMHMLLARVNDVLTIQSFGANPSADPGRAPA